MLKTTDFQLSLVSRVLARRQTGEEEGTACEAVAISADRSNEARTHPRDKNHALAATRLNALRLFIRKSLSHLRPVTFSFHAFCQTRD